MTWWSSRRAVRTSSTWALEELVALPELGQLLEGQRVDRAQGGQLGLELLDPGRRVDALGQLGGRGGQGLLGAAASSRRRVSMTDSRRMVASTRSSSTFCSRLRAAASSCSLADRWRRSSSSRAPPARTASSWRRWRSRSSARAESSRVWADRHHPQQPLHGGGVGLQPGPALGGLHGARRRARSAGAPPRPAARSGPGDARRGRPSGPPTRCGARPPRRSARRSAGAPHGPPPPARPPGPGPSSSTGQLLPRARPTRAVSRAMRSSSSAQAAADLLELGRPGPAGRSATRWRAARAVWWATSLRSSARTASAAAARVDSTAARAAVALLGGLRPRPPRPPRPGPGPRRPRRR